jgi:hypothetical protein
LTSGCPGACYGCPGACCGCPGACYGCPGACCGKRLPLHGRSLVGGGGPVEGVGPAAQRRSMGRHHTRRRPAAAALPAEAPAASRPRAARKPVGLWSGVVVLGLSAREHRLRFAPVTFA